MIYLHLLTMKLFIDSANLHEIEAAASWGVVDGVTTNPTLMAKERATTSDLKKAVREICTLVKGPVSVEAMTDTCDLIVKEAQQIATWHHNVVVKIPCTTEGLRATKILSGQGIKTNVTLVFSPNQVLLAAKAGATFISPFVGRLDDSGEDGIKMIEEALCIIKNYDFKSQIIVASVRSPRTVACAALLGAHVATVPFKILEQMVQHPLTEKGIEKFQADWGEAQKK